MKKITLKTVKGKHIVTIDDETVVMFRTLHTAWLFIGIANKIFSIA